MNEYIEVISQIKPKNNAKFAIADVNDLLGGYIQVTELSEMTSFPTNKIKEGMLCYVKNVSENKHMYQYSSGEWTLWSAQGGSGGTSIQTVDNLSDLDNSDLKIKGQIVFVNEVSDLRYYDGSNWKSFTRIYIQSTEPTDTGGIWIDTSENKNYLQSNEVIQELLKALNVLQTKVKKIEYALECQMDSGDFTNNQSDFYDGQDSEEPSYGTSVAEDEAEQTANQNIVLGDSTEPTDYSDYIPNLKHLCIKAGTYAQLIANKDNFLPKELLWCYDKQALYIKDPKTYKLIQIGSNTSVDDDTMDGILTEIINSKTKITGIEFVDINNKNNTYLMQVKDGKVDLYNESLDTNTLASNSQTAGTTSGYYTSLYFPITSDNVGSTDSPKIYINMIYCGDENTGDSYSPVSHNFVELSNLGNSDLNLKGLYLHYTERNTGNWVSLPLVGTIKSNGTFLIRGAQCMESTLINVGTPDMYWTKSATYNNSVLEISGERTLWDSNGLIKFSSNCSFYISGEESTDYYKSNVLTTSAPWTTNGVIKWYVDLVGIGTYNTIKMPCESSQIAQVGTNYLYVRYYSMDPVTQATKAWNARNNSKDWTYINLSNINSSINVEDYVPKNSSENKTIFFNKNLLKDGPNIVTCTFGYNAHTTRCFNWISKGYYDEYIQIRKDGESYDSTGMFESFKYEDKTSNGRSTYANWNNDIYDRIRSVTTDGTPFTVHKFIKVFDEPSTSQKYYYKVGREGAWSEEKSFTIRNRSKVISTGFNFLQVTDQQGFNQEEYETWNISSQFIKANESYDWILNTGDETQNGNRINEWVDYYNTAIYDDKEQMYTVGNNDLCPQNLFKLGTGEDISKVNPMNVNYFFTFEHPYEVPKSSTGVYIPCVYSFIYGDTYFLSMNSEITEIARVNIFGDSTTNIYTDTLKTWATNDLSKISTDTLIRWKVAFCHEAPFTIITANNILSYVKSPTTVSRGGSHLNTVGNYWFSQFLQDNGFKLCLCGHKHTYAESRLIREDKDHTMVPIVYDANGTNASWYKALPTREQALVNVTSSTTDSNNNTLTFVKYVMCQATGYKLVSNKELPAQNIPWLQNYYPVKTQVEDTTTNTATVTVNPNQQFPTYVIWNIYHGSEQEDPNSSIASAVSYRILGKAWKLQTSEGKTPLYKYDSPIKYTSLQKIGGNGSTNPTYNIIVYGENYSA